MNRELLLGYKDAIRGGRELLRCLKKLFPAVLKHIVNIANFIFKQIITILTLYMNWYDLEVEIQRVNFQ